MTFTKNGEDQGDAFQIPKSNIGDAALFPHILAKNVKFEVNFGMSGTFEPIDAWKEALEGGYLKVAEVVPESRVSVFTFELNFLPFQSRLVAQTEN